MIRRQRNKHNRIKDGGFTLVELVVSMALTAILATAVASIMFPIVSIFMDMQKLSRSQMVADMVTDALRRECAAAYVKGVADVRVLNVPDSEDYTVGDNTLTDMLKAANLQSTTGGNVLALRINEGYAKAIYWNTNISGADYDEVRAHDKEETQKMNVVTSKAVYRLLPYDKRGSLETNMPMEIRPGYLHCGYYKTDMTTVTTPENKNVSVFKPDFAYDYTNPFSVNAYNGFTVSVTYDAPVYQTAPNGTASQADKRPVYVVATIKVYDADYEGQNDDTLVCSRRAVICFAEDNVRVTE